jgi:M6 family metalloprotease-like protein
LRRAFFLVVAFLFLSSMIPAAIALQPEGVRSQAGYSGYNYNVISGKHTVTGVQNVLVVLVEFTDIHHTESADAIKNVAIDQLNAYYKEVSYGKISIAGQVYGWYTVNHSMGYYGADDKKPGDDSNLRALAVDSLAILPSSVDITSYDFLVIVHAGKDQAADQWDVLSDEIWSQCYCSVFPDYSEPEPVYARSKVFANYAFLSEFNGVGTFAHEWGHLFGLPDLYNTETSKSYVGFWSLMDTGNLCCYNDQESTPSYIGAWGDALLGWISPTIPDSSIIFSAFNLQPLESLNATAILVPISTSTYYFLEYRTQTGRDTGLTSSGIVIYLVDEGLPSGGGILRVVNPKTNAVFPAQDHAIDLASGVFKPGDEFHDFENLVFAAFVSEHDYVTVLYSKQELTGSFRHSSLGISMQSLTGAYGGQTSLNGTLIDTSGNGLIGGTIESQIFDAMSNQWVNLGSGTTDEAGNYAFRVDLPRVYTVGTYMLRVIYPGGKVGNVWYTSSSVDLTLEIVPAKMNLELSVPQSNIGDRIPIEVIAVGPQGEPLAGVAVKIYINNVQQTVLTTNADGKASLTYQLRPIDLGDRRITVSGTLANYEPNETSANVFVLSYWLVVIVLAGLVCTLLLLYTRTHRRSRPIPGVRESAPTFPCSKCGLDIPSDSTFCPECGARISHEDSATSAVQ